jgi:hypothetical protein
MTKEELAAFLAEWFKRNGGVYADEDLSSFGIDYQVDLYDLSEAILQKLS